MNGPIFNAYICFKQPLSNRYIYPPSREPPRYADSHLSERTVTAYDIWYLQMVICPQDCGMEVLVMAPWTRGYVLVVKVGLGGHGGVV